MNRLSTVCHKVAHDDLHFYFAGHWRVFWESTQLC